MNRLFKVVRSAVLALASLALWPAPAALAQISVFTESAIIGDSSAVAVVDRPLTIVTAGPHDVVLRDLQVPAALVSVRAAITRGDIVVQTLTIEAGAPGPITRRVDLSAGDYRIRIVGVPTTTDRSGAASIQVLRVSDSVEVQQFTTALSLDPPATPANTRVFERSFTVSDTSIHTVSVVDLAFPQAAQAVNAILTRGSAVVGSPLATAGSFTFTGQPQAPGETTTYTLRVIGTASTAAAGALIHVRVRSAGGANVVDETVSAGQVRNAGVTTLAAGGHTLRLTDLAFPVALSGPQAIGVRDGLAAVRGVTAGDTAFTATAGSHRFFVLARTSSDPGTGSYALDVQQGGASVFTAAEAVTVGAVATPAFSYIADLPAAGSYQLRLADFQFPNTFASLRVLATQGGAALGTLTATGNLDLTGLRAGRLHLIALAQSGTTTTGGGVFGVEVAPAAGGAVVFDVNQGAGALFAPRKFTIATAGRYDVTVRDLEFPVRFIELFALVTRGPSRVGSIFNGGTFSFDATPGTYFINFISRPDLAQKAGTYSLNVAPSPPAPTLILTASPTSVASGATTSLTWSTTNATACTASGGWTGSRATSGTEASSAVTASTTFTLNCTGSGGSVSQSVTVSVTPASAAGGGGGGGRIDGMLLLVLLGAGILAVRRRSAPGL